jgi:CHAT domain
LGAQVSRIEVSEETLRASLAEEDKALDAIEGRLKTEFPDYAALARPEPLSIAEVQGQLGANEALVLFLDVDKWATVTGEETFIWAITKTESRWVRSELGTKSLTEKVATLRCGLDSSNWIDASRWSAVTDDGRGRKEAQIARREHCEQLTGTKIADGAPPPFDLVKSYELYQALFGRIAGLVKDKQLLIVPSGPLTSLPFQVLVTDTPEFAIPRNASDYATAQWLIRQSSLTVLPSVSSLKALRRDAKPSQATIPLIGFGNPLLLGPKETDNRAFAKQTCPKTPATAEPLKIAALGTTDPRASFFRGGLGDVAILRRQAPLPETADELCTIAGEVGASEADIHLGAGATETVVKTLNADGSFTRPAFCILPRTGLSRVRLSVSPTPSRSPPCS